MGPAFISPCFRTSGGRFSDKYVLLDIFLSKNHIAGKRLSEHLILPLGLSISKMKHNLACLRLLYNLGVKVRLVYVVLNGLTDQRPKYGTVKPTVGSLGLLFYPSPCYFLSQLLAPLLKTFHRGRMLTSA